MKNQDGKSNITVKNNEKPKCQQINTTKITNNISNTEATSSVVHTGQFNSPSNSNQSSLNNLIINSNLLGNFQEDIIQSIQSNNSNLNLNNNSKKQLKTPKEPIVANLANSNSNYDSNFIANNNINPFPQSIHNHKLNTKVLFNQPSSSIKNTINHISNQNQSNFGGKINSKIAQSQSTSKEKITLIGVNSSYMVENNNNFVHIKKKQKPSNCDEITEDINGEMKEQQKKCLENNYLDINNNKLEKIEKSKANNMESRRSNSNKKSSILNQNQDYYLSKINKDSALNMQNNEKPVNSNSTINNSDESKPQIINNKPQLLTKYTSSNNVSNNTNLNIGGAPDNSNVNSNSNSNSTNTPAETGKIYQNITRSNSNQNNYKWMQKESCLTSGNTNETMDNNAQLSVVVNTAVCENYINQTNIVNNPTNNLNHNLIKTNLSKKGLVQNTTTTSNNNIMNTAINSKNVDNKKLEKFTHLIKPSYEQEITKNDKEKILKFCFKKEVNKISNQLLRNEYEKKGLNTKEGNITQNITMKELNNLSK